MEVVPLKAFTDNYIWVLIDRETESFDCVDPGDAAPILEFALLHQLKLRSVLLTHHHFDHISGVDALLHSYPSCIVYGPQDLRIPNVSHPVGGGDLLTVGKHCYQVLTTPGHTATHISYYEANCKWLFPGDTLFSAGCGRVFDGTIEQLHQSLLLYKTLPLSTKVFCAHEYTLQNLRFAVTIEPNNEHLQRYLHKLNTQPTTCTLPTNIGLELTINPFLRTNIAAISRLAQNKGALSTDSLDVFQWLREEKNNFT